MKSTDLFELHSIAKKLPSITKNAINEHNWGHTYVYEIESIKFLKKLKRVRKLGPKGIVFVYEELIRRGFKLKWNPEMKPFEYSSRNYLVKINMLHRQILNNKKRIKECELTIEGAQKQINKLMLLHKEMLH